MFLTKEGYYNNKTMEVDIPSARFIPYNYKEKEFLSLSKERQIPCFNVETNISISLKNGWLKINNREYNIVDYYVTDVLSILEEQGCLVNLFSGYEVLQTLPAYLLKDFSNTCTVSISANKSPLKFEKEITDPASLFNGILAKDFSTINIVLFDTNTNEEINKIIDSNNFIYFEPTVGAKVVVQYLCRNFQTNISLDSKIFTNVNISNIIKNKEIG